MIYIITQEEQGIKKHGENDSAPGHFCIAWLTGPVLAQKYGLRHIYTNPIPEYMGNEWNEFLGFGKEYSLDAIKDYPIIDLPRIPFPAKASQFDEIINNISEENVILRTQPGQSLEIDWEYYLENDLREKYDIARRENPIELHNPDDYYTICLHWRRGDISQRKQPERWITNEQYYKLINNIKNIFDNLYIRYKIQIISEGEQKDFGCVNDIEGIDFILNEDPMISFHRMAISDILVNAKSAFSVLAAYLHKRIRLCFPFSIYWKQTHPNNDNFKNFIWINDNMDFNKEKLLKVINE